MIVIDSKYLSYEKKMRSNVGIYVEEEGLWVLPIPNIYRGRALLNLVNSYRCNEAFIFFDELRLKL